MQHSQLLLQAPALRRKRMCAIISTTACECKLRSQRELTPPTAVAAGATGAAASIQDEAGELLPHSHLLLLQERSRL